MMAAEKIIGLISLSTRSVISLSSKLLVLIEGGNGINKCTKITIIFIVCTQRFYSIGFFVRLKQVLMRVKVTNQLFKCKYFTVFSTNV